MVMLSTKSINGRKYLYAEYSFRLPDGSLKKLSKRITSDKDAKAPGTRAYFLQKETETSQVWALKKYSRDRIFTEKRIAEFERYRVGFKRIKNELSKHQFDDLLKRFTCNFTYESNALEGNSLTLKDVTLLLYENVLPKNKELREIFETRNTHAAHELLFRGKVRLNIAYVLKIHKLVVKDMKIPVGWKTVPNFLVMRSVKTTPPERVQSDIEELFAWYESVRDTWHALKIAAHFHARFERIHPFEDGNGRVGRILLNAILMDSGYPPLIIRRTMRQSYFSALDAADKRHFDKMENFLIEKFRDTYNKFFEIYIKYV
ncbi:MAG: Fic family protein [Candidatus Woesearchaeota archaeon]